MEKDNVSHKKGSVIPIVDFSAFCGPNDKNQDKGDELSLATDIVNAFKKTGFIYLTNFGIPTSQVKEMRDYSRRFFSLPDEVKQIYHRGTTDDGWVPFAKESLDVTKPSDLKESFSVTMKYSLPWPDEHVEGLHDVMEDFISQCRNLVKKVLRLLAIGLELEDNDFFLKCHNFDCKDNCTALRCLHYPPITPDVPLLEGQLRCGEHSDWGTITLLFQDDAGGLEVLNRDGEWVPATTIPETVLVNVADMMQRWTDDLLISTRHRVIIPVDEASITKPRYSMAYFVIPDSDFPIKSISGNGKYKPITSRSYIDEKLSSTSNY